MRCPKCSRDLEDNTRVCPYCDFVIHSDESEIDLPELKEEDDFEWERTRSISPIHDSELSLIDDINEEIDKEAPKDEKEYVDNGNGIDEIGEVNVGDVSLSTNNVNSVLESKESINKRKIILIVCVFCTVLAVILTVMVISNNTKNESYKVEKADYLEEYHLALSRYYDSGDIDDVVIILQENKNDPERVEEIQRKTRITCDSWLLSYMSEKIENKEQFENVTSKYETFLYGLNHYAIATIDDKEIKALPDSDYLELSNQLGNVYQDGMVFYDALELYNKKDYNKAYNDFEMINYSSSFYDNASFYEEKIIENILELLKKDLAKLEKDIDGLSVDEKIERYVQMEEIILEYERVYLSVPLTKNDTYNNTLQDCRDKIDEYSKVKTDDNE